VAIVGARAATAYACRVAREVAAACATAGVAVVSGLARGVDAAAHAAALGHGGTTLAVLGTGVDTVYPPEHRRLYTAIRARGWLVSALPHGAPPRRAHFPSRNRLMAALVEGVVLVQADARSGTGHTLRAVLACGGWALVAPWPLGDARFAGNADWLAARAGGAARHAARVGILTDAAAPVRRIRFAPVTAGAAAGATAEDRLLAAATARPRALGALAREAGLDVAVAAGAALRLELAGALVRGAGDRYRRSRR
jgi:DNA processing protein